MYLVLGTDPERGMGSNPVRSLKFRIFATTLITYVYTKMIYNVISALRCEKSEIIFKSQPRSQGFSLGFFAWALGTSVIKHACNVFSKRIRWKQKLYSKL